MHQALLDMPIAPEDEGLRRLFEYWDGKRAGRPFPARSDIDPLDFFHILGWVMLIDVARDPLRFSFRLYGSELADQMNFDVTGRDLQDHPDAEFRAATERQWTETIRRGMPTIAGLGVRGD